MNPKIGGMMNLQFQNNPNFFQDIHRTAQRQEFCQAISSNKQNPSHWSEVVAQLCSAAPSNVSDEKVDAAIADILRRLSPSLKQSSLHIVKDYVLRKVSAQIFNNPPHKNEMNLQREDSIKKALHFAISKELHKTAFMLIKRMEPEIAYMELLTLKNQGLLPPCLNPVMQEIENELDVERKAIIETAENINRNKIPLKQVSEDRTKLTQLAPFLTHVDCSEMEFKNWKDAEVNDWIAKCTNAESLTIHSIKISEFGYLLKCVHLDCSSCMLLRNLPDKMPACKSLNCDNTSITVLQTELEACEKLSCRLCASLQAVTSNLRSCLSFDSSYCGALVSISSPLRVCQEARFNWCPLLSDYPAELERLNPAQVVAEEPEKLPIKLQDLEENPKEVLADFAQKSLSLGKLPKIVFIDRGGEKSQGFDLGGLKRQLATSLFKNLFENSKLDRCLDFYRGADGIIPLMKNDKKDASHYKNMGLILGYAYFNDINIGKLFAPKVFEAISILLKENDFENDSPKLYCVLNGMDFISSILENGEVEDYGKSQLEELRYFLFSEDGMLQDDALTIDQLEERLLTFDGKRGIEQLIKEKITILSKEPEYQEMLLPLIYLVKGMQSLPEIETLRKASAEELSEKIQGALTKEMLIAALKFPDLESTPVNSSQDDVVLGPEHREKAVKAQEFFFNWIQECDDKKLKSFATAVSGSSTLSSTTKIQVKLTNPDNPNTLPSCSTCAIKINIPITYDNQALFDDKMDLFLAESQSGTGFQFA